MEPNKITQIEIDSEGFVTNGPEGMLGASVISNMVVPETPDADGKVLYAKTTNLPCRWKQRLDGSWY